MSTLRVYRIKVCPECHGQLGRGDNGEILCRTHGEMKPLSIRVVSAELAGREQEQLRDQMDDAFAAGEDHAYEQVRKALRNPTTKDTP